MSSRLHATFASSSKPNHLVQLLTSIFHERGNKRLFANIRAVSSTSLTRSISGRRRRGERAPKQCVIPTVKDDGDSVMIWVCLGGMVVDDVKIEVMLGNPELRLLGATFEFNQGNNPKHPTKRCKGYLQYLEADGTINVTEWSLQSPNLNFIELLCKKLDLEV
ncbi:hypothetical protein Trydic_g15741 [Trypoxylus dichotomus]